MGREVTIESADNGFIVRCYHEGGKGEPGRSVRKVASDRDGALRLASGILGGGEKGKTRGKSSKRGRKRSYGRG